MRVLVFTLAICATGGAWAAAGDSVTFANDGRSFSWAHMDFADSNSYTITIPSGGSLSAGDYVRVNSFAFGRNSVNDAVNVASVTSVDFAGNTISSASYATNNKFPTVAAWKEKYSFGAAGSANDLILKVGETYDFALLDSSGSTPTQHLGVYTTTDGTYSPVAQTVTDASTKRMQQEVVVTVLASVVTSAGGNWSALSWSNAPADWSSASAAPVLVIVEESCSIALDTSVVVDSIIFDIKPGKTLTLTGDASITASVVIINGGTVVSSGKHRLSGAGTIKGDGTYWLKSFVAGQINASKFPSSGFKLRLTGVTGFFTYGQTLAGTLDLQDEGETKAFTITDGWSTNDPAVFEKLTGTGTLTNSKTDVFQRYQFKDVSGFEGNINIVPGNAAVGVSPNRPFRVIIGSDAIGNYDYYGGIVISSGKIVSVAANKTWSAPGGIIVKGQLTVGNGAIIPAIAAESTGSVIVTSGTATINGVKNNAISSGLDMLGGTIALADNTTPITELTIPADSGLQTQTFVASDGGKLDLSACTSLTTLKLNLGSSKTFDISNVKLPASCTRVVYSIGALRDLSGYEINNLGEGVNWDFSATESKAEYGAGTFSVANVPDGARVSVTRVDGTVTNAIVEDSTARFADYGGIKISGAATAFDATFTNTLAMAYKQNSNANISCDVNPATYNNALNDKTTGLNLYHRPYIVSGNNVLGDLPSIQGKMTVVVVGQMSNAKKKMFLHMGYTTEGKAGLLITRNDKDDEVLIAYNNGAAVNPIDTMSVPNCDKARHAYVVTKEDFDDRSVFTIYLDGIKWKTVPVTPKLVLESGGVQLGSDFGGAIKNNSEDYEAVTSSADTGYVNVLRIFDRVLTEPEIKQFSIDSEYPYISPNGSSSRTFDADGNWIDETESSEVWNNSVGDNSGTPTVGASITIDASAEVAITVNLEDETSYEALTVKGSPVTFTPSTGIVKVGMTLVGTTITNVYGAVNMHNGPMTITEEGDITFDYSGYNAAEVYELHDEPLTGDITQNDSKVHLIAPTALGRTCELVYTGTRYVMRVTPDHTNGDNVFYTGGIWSSTSEDFAITNSSGAATAVFPEDTVVIPASLEGSSVTFGSTLPANVSKIRVEKDYTFNFLGTQVVGLEIYVPSGITLTLGTGTLTGAPITFTGGGTVKCSTANSLMGFIHGDATITIEYPNQTLPNAAAIWTETPWMGTLVITNCGLQNVSSQTRTVPFETYGNRNSKIKAPGFKGHSAVAASTRCTAELIIDEGTTFEFNHGATPLVDIENAGFRFRELSGSGTLRLDGTSDTAQYIFEAVSNFTGTVEITDPNPGEAVGGKKSFILGAPENWNITGSDYPANLVIAGAVNVPDGKFWDTPAGVVILNDGTLTLGAGARISGIDSKSHGTLAVAAGESGTVVELKQYATGKAEVTAGLSIPAEATLKICDTNSTAMLTIPADSSEGGTYSNAGKLDLSTCGSLNELHLVLGEAKTFDFGHITLPTPVPTIVYDIGSVRDLTGYDLRGNVGEGTNCFYYATETAEEYANGGFIVSNVADNVALWLYRRNGALINTTVSNGTDRVYAGGRSFAGAACWHEWDFEHDAWSDRLNDTGRFSTNEVYNSELKTLQVVGGNAANIYGDCTVPLRGETKNCLSSAVKPNAEISFGDNWSAAVRCTMPTVEEGKQVAISFGDTSTGVFGLASVAGGLVELFNWTNNVYTTLARLQVESASSDMHIYVFTVTNDTETSTKWVSLSRDGEFIHKARLALTGSIGKFMINDVSGRSGGEDIPAAASTGSVDYIRLYDRVLNKNDIEGLSLRRPFVSAFETYVRTVDGPANWVEEDAWNSKTNSALTVDSPEDGTHVTLTVEFDTAMSVNLNDDSTYGTLILDGDGEITLSPAVGKTGRIKANMFVARTPTTINYGAAYLRDAMVGVDEGASLTFDFTDYPFAATQEVIKLTGPVVAREYDATVDSRIRVVNPHSHTWTVTGPTPAEDLTYSVTITPIRTVGTDAIYYKSGYLTAGMTGLFSDSGFEHETSLIEGDKVEISDDSSVSAPNDAWVSDKFNGNIYVTRSTLNLMPGDDNNGILSNRTITVASGKVLNLKAYTGNDTVRKFNFGALTLNGLGTVNILDDAEVTSLAGDANIIIAEGVTLTIKSASNAYTGTMSGSGTVKIESVGVTGFNFAPYDGCGTIAVESFGTWIDRSDKLSLSASPYVEVNSALRLDGDMVITGLSPWPYTFAKLTGTGGLTIPNSSETPTKFEITKVEDFTGTITNNHTSKSVTVGRIALASDVNGGTLLLATNGVGTVAVSTVYVGNTPKYDSSDEDSSAWKLAGAEGGIYRASAKYAGVYYATIQAAMDVAGDENYGNIDVLLNTGADVPEGYFVTGEGKLTTGKAAIYIGGVLNESYATVQAAVNEVIYEAYMHPTTYTYDYVAVYANETVTPITLENPLKIKHEGGEATVTFPGITSEYRLNSTTNDTTKVITYTLDPVSTVYYWDADSSTGVWDTLVPWRYTVLEDDVPTLTQATRTPVSVDNVVFSADTTAQLLKNVQVSSITNSAAITLIKNTSDVTVTIGDGGVVLTEKDASITLGEGVTLSETPTTTVEGAKVFLDGNTYKVVYGTIFSVY